MKKLIVVLALAGTITCQAHASTALSQHISTINPTLDKRTVKALVQELAKYPKIMTHIAKKESTFNPKAYSLGNVGLTGVNVKVWAEILIEEKIIKRVHDLWSIKHNLKAGYYILKHYQGSYRKYRHGH